MDSFWDLNIEEDSVANIEKQALIAIEEYVEKHLSIILELEEHDRTINWMILLLEYAILTDDIKYLYLSFPDKKLWNGILPKLPQEKIDLINSLSIKKDIELPSIDGKIDSVGEASILLISARSIDTIVEYHPDELLKVINSEDATLLGVYADNTLVIKLSHSSSLWQLLNLADEILSIPSWTKSIYKIRSFKDSEGNNVVHLHYDSYC